MTWNMDVASLAAEWVAVVVTLIGLSSLILQLTNFQTMFDPFRDYRKRDWLGPWANDTDSGVLPLKGSSPRGPEIHGTYANGFCESKDLHVSRKPLPDQRGYASWTSIFAIFHPDPLPLVRRSSRSLAPKQKFGEKEIEDIPVAVVRNKPWRSRLPTIELIVHRKKICTTITRTAFITCLVVTNSYQLYKYSDAAGLRAAYSGYSGTWQVHWPLGGRAEIEFFPLDSHDDKEQDKHPPSFRRRVDKCILMLIGILEHKDLGKLSFPEPKDDGSSVLELLPRGYIAHGKSSHLFNMMGGNPYEVDHLFRRALQEDEEEKHANDRKLMVPTPELDLNRRLVKPWDKSQRYSIVYVPRAEEEILAKTLDCLPWSPLGWSVHRGMQCLLVAYGERVMKAYRKAFAHTLKQAIKIHASVLESEGWSSNIVRDYMPANSAASVKAGGGDSGDSVRIVTAAARLMSSKADDELDTTQFWRHRVGQVAPEEVPEKTPLDEDTVIALTKLFVLEWSNELDHKLYEDLPLFLLVA